MKILEVNSQQKYYNNMKKFIKENWFKLVIAFAILLIGFSFFYFYVIRPALNKLKLDECLAQWGLFAPSNDECFKKYPQK